STHPPRPTPTLFPYTTLFRSNPYYLTLARYNANGTLDTTFGSGGKVISHVGSGDSEGYSVALQSDGKIVVGGMFVDTNSQVQFRSEEHTSELHHDQISYAVFC